MAVCLAQSTDGVVSVAVPQPANLATCPGMLALSGSEYQSFLSANGPFDYVLAGAIWAFFFTFVLGLYLSTKGIYAVPHAVRKL